MKKRCLVGLAVLSLCGTSAFAQPTLGTAIAPGAQDPFETSYCYINWLGQRECIARD